MMRVKVQKNGEQLIVCIPNDLADKLELKAGSEIELRIVNGCLKLYPPGAPRYRLEELVEGITSENRHDEVDWGPPVGEEVW